jgi:hypothetical protein
MNIGSLYKVKKYFWLLCPTKETALLAVAAAAGAAAASARTAASAAEASYWSRRFNCEVTYFSPESYIVFLEEDGVFKKVLTSEGLIGWTCFDESYNDSFEEVETES